MIFCDWSHWWTRIYHLLMKAWLGDLPVGKLGDLQAMFSSVAGRGEFTFHIWIFGPSEVCAVSWGKFWILGLNEVCASFKKIILPSSTRVHHFKSIWVQFINTWIYIFKLICQWMFQARCVHHKCLMLVSSCSANWTKQNVCTKTTRYKHTLLWL